MEDSVTAAIIEAIAPVIIAIIVAWLAWQTHNYVRTVMPSRARARASSWLAWLIRNYIRALGEEKNLSTIIRVANAAIDYAEDLEKRGDLDKIISELDLPQDIIGHTSGGIKKLHVAGKWVEDELKRMGIEMTDKEAQRWVAAEFQKRNAGLNLTPQHLAHIQEISTLLQNLDQDKLAALSTLGSSRATFGDEPTRQQDPLPVEPGPSTTEVEPDHPSQDPALEAEPTVESDLAVLAQQAVDYVETLKATRELTVPEIDIATAWMLTEVTKQGLHVTPDQIAREIHQAFIEFETSS
jgi:hypothetical protein